MEAIEVKLSDKTVNVHEPWATDFGLYTRVAKYLSKLAPSKEQEALDPRAFGEAVTDEENEEILRLASHCADMPEEDVRKLGVGDYLGLVLALTELSARMENGPLAAKKNSPSSPTRRPTKAR